MLVSAFIVDFCLLAKNVCDNMNSPLWDDEFHLDLDH